MEIVKRIFSETRGEQWGDGIQWLVWTFVTGLLPLWGTIVLLALLSQKISVSHLMANGEFVLYAASYAGGAIYLVMRDFRKTIFPSRVWMMILLVVIVLISTLIFSGITSLTLVDKGGQLKLAKLIDAQMVESASWWLLSLSIVFGFGVVIADNIRTNPDIQESGKRQLDQLGKDFDQLGGSHE
ncbi:MAG: hypothetical protein HY661_16760 [Betaproteobacteria bacterium]|nr:hypothetical protein [Betaproteobacteria bacterium]